METAVPDTGTPDAGEETPARTGQPDTAEPAAGPDAQVTQDQEASPGTAGPAGRIPAPRPGTPVPGEGAPRQGNDAAPAPVPHRPPARVRVLWLAQGLGLSGAERLLLTGARHMDRSRFEVEVAYVQPQQDALVADFARAGVRVHCLTGRPDRRRTDPLWPFRLRRLVKERGYGLVHTHMPLTAVVARLLLRGDIGVPLVHTEHDLWPHYSLPTRLANAATYRSNAAVVAASRAIAASIGKAAEQDRLSIIQHSPDLGGAPAVAQPGPEARAALGVPQNAVVVGTVGNLTARKDHATLLDAFASMLRSHPDAVLVLIGSGPLERSLRDRADSLRLGDRVVFAGPRSDIPALLPGFDVFALSSRQEGLPVALMEAMAAGLPSVVTRVGGIPEIVDQGVEALLVQPGDTEALAVALGRLVGGTALRARMAAAARERARRFSPARAQRGIEAVYDRVLAAAAAPQPRTR